MVRLGSWHWGVGTWCAKKAAGTALLAIAKQCPHLRNLTINVCDDYLDHVDDDGNVFSDSSVMNALKCWPQMQSFQLDSDKMSSKVFTAVVKHCPQLRALPVENKFTHDMHLGIESGTLFRKCPALTTISLYSPQNETIIALSQQ